MKTLLRAALVCAAIAVISSSLAVGASAEDSFFKDKLGEIEKAIPFDVAELLPDDLFSAETPGEAAQGASGALDSGFFADFLKKALKSSLAPAVSLASMLLIVLAVCAVYGAMRKCVESGALTAAFDLVCSLCVAMTIYGALKASVDAAVEFTQRLCVFMTTLVPVTAALLVSGGGGGSAAAFSGGVLTMISLLENICVTGLAPVMSACFAFALCGAVSDGASLSGISKLLRSFYTSALALVGSVFGLVLTMQTSLSEAADNLVAKTVKYAVSETVPIVGGALSDAVRTVGAGLGALKDTAGWLGIAAIVIMVVPTLATLGLNCLAVKFASAAAEALGCAKEKKLLDDCGSIVGFAFAVSVLSAVMMIFALALFVRISVATAS